MSAQRVEIIHTVEAYKGKSHKFDPDKAYIVDGQEVHVYAFRKVDPPKDQVTIVLASQMLDPQADMVPIEVEDTELNAIADQRINGPFVPVVLEGISGWKPIDTAPKDGSRIILTDGVSVDAAEWDFIEEWVKNVESSTGFNYYSKFYAPTHWMPLPTPSGCGATGETE